MEKKSCVITGRSGFIGSALNKRLLSMGWEVHEELRPDVDYVFLFGSPSSNNWFNHALSYSVRETIENFISVAEFCGDHKIKLIYPSSGTVYQGDTAYAKTKKILEQLAEIYDIDALGLRIFAGYGPGEGHKKGYSSVVYEFTKEMMAGRSPVIWGDGRQVRDFIYIDDIIDNIMKFRHKAGVVDIGTGLGWTFNQVVKIINWKLGAHIKPRFIKRPDLYVDESISKSSSGYKISLLEGIERIINEETME